MNKEHNNNAVKPVVFFKVVQNQNRQKTKRRLPKRGVSIQPHCHFQFNRICKCLITDCFLGFYPKYYIYFVCVKLCILTDSYQDFRKIMICLRGCQSP